ncbi:hypothetical protein KIH75_01405 [Bifidobacterium sp. 64T4]|uniref:hypothetical protein n=1 Tax=Bifidobacterium pongonis TaxID=2834432 RepID=UPI001C55C7D6|nr:hypothetical protein [Bifidobacterium pongonis]MBW3094028.1 hypothetical protein [Bifidobacterium pongonis]
MFVLPNLLFFWSLIVAIGSFVLAVVSAVDDARRADRLTVRIVATCVAVALFSAWLASYAYATCSADRISLTDLIVLSFLTVVFTLGDWGSMRRIQRRALALVCLCAFALSLVFLAIVVAAYCAA